MLIDSCHLSEEKRLYLCADLQNEQCGVKHKECFGITKCLRIILDWPLVNFLGVRKEKMRALPPNIAHLQILPATQAIDIFRFYFDV